MRHILFKRSKLVKFSLNQRKKKANEPKRNGGVNQNRGLSISMNKQ